MPIFEYRCRRCGTRFEKFQPSAKDPVRCQHCQSADLDRLLSVFAVAGTSARTASSEDGPCGACGAPRRGMCGE